MLSTRMHNNSNLVPTSAPASSLAISSPLELFSPTSPSSLNLHLKGHLSLHHQAPPSNNDVYNSLGKLFDDTIATNTICCGILCAYKIIQYLVLGKLRVAEQQHLREVFWDYLLRKSLFILFVVDARSYQDRLHWTVWFTVLGSIELLSSSCKDRYEYLSSSPTIKRISLIKIAILMSTLLLTSLCINAALLLLSSPIFLSIFDIQIPNYPTNSLLVFTTRSLFILADSTYVLAFVISVITRCLILTYDMRTNSIWENRTSVIYYSDLIFATLMSSIDLLHHLHLLIISYTSMMIKLYCLLKIHTIIKELTRRYIRHINFLLVIQLMESNFPMANKEDLDKNSDDCAICWDEMESARKLPCGHLFHNSCLRSWLEQDTSCPTCRTSLKTRQQGDQIIIDDRLTNSEDEFIETEVTTPLLLNQQTANITTRTTRGNHFFSFDSSRYTNHPFLSWLPTISIEAFM